MLSYFSFILYYASLTPSRLKTIPTNHIIGCKGEKNSNRTQNEKSLEFLESWNHKQLPTQVLAPHLKYNFAVIWFCALLKKKKFLQSASHQLRKKNSCN